MDENMELLLEVYQNAEMGVYTTTFLTKKLEDKENKIKHLLESELNEYEKHFNLCEKLLKKNEVPLKGTGTMEKISSNIGITMETMKDNSDSALAQMIIEGVTMGIVSITSSLEKYKSVCDKNIIKIAKNYVKFQEKEIEKLKEFL